MTQAHPRHGAATHIGHDRDMQEDAYLAEPPLFVVADGMGGHAGGDVASKEAVEVIARSDNNKLKAAAEDAHRSISEMAASDAGLEGMGTTLTAVRLNGDFAELVHVGDSRAYLLREGQLTQLTRDHTVVGRMVRQGELTPEEAAVHPGRSRLERALGVSSKLVVDTDRIPLQQGDRLLLCTDGLSGMVDDHQIVRILTQQKDAQTASNRLVEAALEGGGHDNVTVVVIDVGGEAPDVAATHRRKRLAIGLSALAVVLAILATGWLIVRSSWYVGVSDDKVAVYRGVDASVGGLELSEVHSTSELDVDSLPEPFATRVREGVVVGGPDEGLELIERWGELPRRADAP